MTDLAATQKLSADGRCQSCELLDCKYTGNCFILRGQQATLIGNFAFCFINCLIYYIRQMNLIWRPTNTPSRRLFSVDGKTCS